MKLKKENKYYLWLILILLLAFALRFYKLGTLLPLFGDEVDMGYNSYSILKTGRDVTGHFLPVYLKTLIDTKSSLLAYLTTLPVFLFGLNETIVRIIPALSGVLIVWLVFLIVNKLSENKPAALIASFLVAVVPWAIHFSRGVFEVNQMVFLLLLGIFAYLKLPENKNYLFLSVMAFALSFYAYHAAKALTPLIILGLISFFPEFLKKINKKKIIMSVLAFLIMSLPMIYASVFTGGQQRFSEVSLFKDDKIIDKIVTKRQADLRLPLSGRFFHNKGEAYFNKLASNYLESFSPQFLFLAGDLNFRHSSGGNGELYLICLPFFLIGLFAFLKERKRYQKFLIYLMLIAPLPATITRDSQHAIRLLFLMPIVLMISAFGLSGFINWLNKQFKRKLLRILIYVFLLMIFVLNFTFYLHQYFWHYPQESWRYWAYGYKEAMQEVNKLEKNYDKIFIENTYEPSLLWFLFWHQYPAKEFQQKFTGGEYQSNILPGVDGFNLDKFYFGKINEQSQKEGGVAKVLSENKNTIFLITQEKEVGGDWDWRKNPPGGVKVLKTVANPYNQPIFYLVTHE
ncbi:glycosyltransferase family 39 protein [Patescibacteria group bacterium]|nr:glycosyltransferase family 39 protein [Patescibacteria group bacterium]